MFIRKLVKLLQISTYAVANLLYIICEQVFYSDERDEFPSFQRPCGTHQRDSTLSETTEEVPEVCVLRSLFVHSVPLYQCTKTSLRIQVIIFVLNKTRTRPFVKILLRYNTVGILRRCFLNYFTLLVKFRL